MKHSIRLLLAVLIFLVLPVTVYAETYRMTETDLSVQVDSSIWYVFTRDNIENNAELEELGISYDAMRSILYENNVYMDAVLYYDNGEYIELYVRKTPQTSGLANLSNYSDDDVLEFAAALAKNQDAQVYSVHKNEYKFSRVEYLDANAELYVCEFITIVNKNNYTFTFQSSFEFGDLEYEEIESIIDSIQFDIDPAIKEQNNASFGETALKGAIGGAIIGGISGGVIALVNKNKRKKSAEEVN